MGLTTVVLLHTQYIHFTTTYPVGVDGMMQIEEGRRAARHENVHSIKEEILHWGLTFEPPLDPSSKEQRGFYHFDCGKLLCPPEYDWNDPL
jgi:hypothetical protein